MHAARRTRRGGFTLVEMLVAVTVLALLSAMVSQIMGAAQLSSQVCHQRINNFTKARALLDVLAQDLSAALYRTDVAFYPTGQQPTLAFYTRRPGVIASGARNLALVEYAIDSSTSTSILLRSDLAIGWTSQASDVSFGNASTLSNLTRVIPRDTAGGVVGFQVRFLLADGTIQSTYANTAANPLRAVGVTLAVVDDQNMAKMTQAKLTRLRASLAEIAPAGGTVKGTWETALDTDFDWQPYPAGLRSGLQVFERFVYVSPSF